MQASLHLATGKLQQFTRRHRKGLVAGAVSLLAGFGITAVAVAPLVNDAPALQQRVLVQAVQPAGMDTQLEALAAQDLSLIRTDVTRSADTAAALLARLGVRDPAAVQWLRTDVNARALLSGRPGKMVQAVTAADGSLQELVARFATDDTEQARTHFRRLKFSRTGEQWATEIQTLPFGSQLRLSSGTIRSSLFGATDDAGLPDSVAIQLAELFSSEIDFHRQLRKGDTFSLVYETLTADGEPVAWGEGAGRVLAAEFINAGRKHQAVWFVGEDGRGAYFGADGQSRKRTFLASPMEFSRVTSGFAMRMHPILQTLRAHTGVDYAAPVGTPVRTVADGIVEFASTQRGYGKAIEVRHDKSRSTFYAHLSSIDVTLGQRVQQGQSIGKVGMTGLTSGPHLHFESRINGKHEDPLLLAKGAEAPQASLATNARFNEHLRSVKARLEVADTLSGQRVRFE